MRINEIAMLLWTNSLVCQGLLFERNNTMDGGYTGQGLMKTFLPADLTRCAVECYMEEGCVLISHNEALQQCLMYSTRYPGQVSFLPGYLSNFYVASQCFRSDYTYVQSIGICVKVHNTWVSYIYATQICNNERGATMFITSSEARFLFMQDQINIYDGKYWVGGQRDGYFPYEWRWVNGDVITEQNGGQFWLPIKPSSGTERLCMNIYFSLSYELYGYYDTECDIRNKKFICETAALP